MSNNKNKKRVAKPEIQKPAEEIVEKETTIIKPEELKVEEPEIEPAVVTSFEGVPINQETGIYAPFIPVLETPVMFPPIEVTFPDEAPIKLECALMGKDFEIIPDIVAPDLKDVMKDKPDVYDYVTPESHIEGDKVPEELKIFHNIDAEAELMKLLEDEMSKQYGEENVERTLVDNSLEEPKIEVPKVKTLADLTQNELRHFHRTGQMPK